MGVDQSLTGTGFAYRSDDGTPYTGVVAPGKLRGPYRLSYIRAEVAKVVDAACPTLVVLEGYAMGFKRGQGRLADLGELGGTLKLMLWERGIDVMIVPPATLKSALAEHGRADKKMMAAALKKRYGYTVGTDDEVDALSLLLIGEMRCGRVEMPTEGARAASVKKCEVIRGQLKLST